MQLCVKESDIFLHYSIISGNYHNGVKLFNLRLIYDNRLFKLRLFELRLIRNAFSSEKRQNQIKGKTILICIWLKEFWLSSRRRHIVMWIFWLSYCKICIHFSSPVGKNAHSGLEKRGSYKKKKTVAVLQQFKPLTVQHPSISLTLSWISRYLIQLGPFVPIFI